MVTIEPPTPKAQRLLAVIFQQIKRGRTQESKPATFLAFSEALELLGERSPWQHAGSRLRRLGLEDLHEWTEEHPELPKVAGLIVYKNSRRPHKEFPRWHGHEDDPNWQTWWLEEANRAIRFNWKPFLADALDVHEGSNGPSIFQPSFTARWRGKFPLPKPDPADARLTYLLERYDNNHDEGLGR